jgi:O-antigen/teichoic acid export membrane protein
MEAAETAEAAQAVEAGRTAGRQLLGRGSIYTLGAALQLLAAAFAIPAATRLLGSAEYGVVTLAITSQTLLVPIAGLGLPVAILRFFFGDDGEAREPLLARALAMTVPLVAFLTAGLIFLTALAWAPALVPDDPDTMLLGVALCFPGAILGGAMALLRAEDRPFSYITVALISSVGAQALAIGAVLLVHRTSIAYVSGYAVAFAVAALLSLRLSGALGAGLAPRSTLRRALQYSLPTVPNTISIFILAFGDRVIIQLIDGSSAVGKYQIGYAFGGVAIVLVTSLTNAWLPVIFGAAEEHRWSTLAETAGTVTRLSAFAAGFLALVAATVLRFLVPSSYDPGLLADVSAIVALTTLPIAAFAAHSQVLLWTKHTRPLAVITPITATINLILVAVLLGPFGLRGAASATVIAAVFQVLMTDGTIRRHGIHVPWKRRRNLESYALGMAAVALALLVPSGTTGDLIRLGAAGACALGFGWTVLHQFRRPGAAIEAV